MPRRLLFAIAIVVATTAALILLSQQNQRSDVLSDSVTSAPSHPPSVVAWRKLIDSRFAGDQACAECHQPQYEAHLRSGHSRTATLAHLSERARELQKHSYADPVRDMLYEFRLDSHRLYAGIQGTDSTPAFPVHWLLGSGTHAQTPVSIDPVSRNGVEFRWTWFAARQQWGLTPDHERFDEFQPASLECFGRPLGAQQALACVNCHMTVVPTTDVVPTQHAFVPNVGCERCHGPRKDHIQLAKQGKAAEAQPLLQWNSADIYMRQCAECHRDESNTPEDSSPASLARYQPYGIQKSKCFLNSNRQLSCANCHDPHDATSRSPAQYVQACNQCHTKPDQVKCPDNASGNCIECHMPAVEWHPGIQFHDHWIRVPEHPASDASRHGSADSADDDSSPVEPSR